LTPSKAARQTVEQILAAQLVVMTQTMEDQQVVMVQMTADQLEAVEQTMADLQAVVHLLTTILIFSSPEPHQLHSRTTYTTITTSTVNRILTHPK